MPEVRLRKTKGSKKKKGSKKPKRAPVAEVDPLEKQAKDAVAEFEEQHHMLKIMREDFAEEFPDAHTALQAIHQQEDVVTDSLVKAKARVGAAKTTVGEFICNRSFAKAGYDDKKLTEIINNMASAGDMLETLLEHKVIKEFKVDKVAATEFAASNPRVAEELQAAWKDKTEITPRVTVPKL